MSSFAAAITRSVQLRLAPTYPDEVATRPLLGLDAQRYTACATVQTVCACNVRRSCCTSRNQRTNGRDEPCCSIPCSGRTRSQLLRTEKKPAPVWKLPLSVR